MRVTYEGIQRWQLQMTECNSGRFHLGCVAFLKLNFALAQSSTDSLTLPSECHVIGILYSVCFLIYMLEQIFQSKIVKSVNYNNNYNNIYHICMYKVETLTRVRLHFEAVSFYDDEFIYIIIVT